MKSPTLVMLGLHTFNFLPAKGHSAKRGKGWPEGLFILFRLTLWTVYCCFLELLYGIGLSVMSLDRPMGPSVLPREFVAPMLHVKECAETWSWWGCSSTEVFRATLLVVASLLVPLHFVQLLSNFFAIVFTAVGSRAREIIFRKPCLTSKTRSKSAPTRRRRKTTCQLQTVPSRLKLGSCWTVWRTSAW